MADDLDGMAVFVAVAEARGFRAAGERLGVSGSAVSQALRRLEERVLSDSALNLRLVRAGVGLTIVYEAQVRDEVARGELVPVLEEFCTPFPGYYLFYPQRRHASPALRALVDYLRREQRPPR